MVAEQEKALTLWDVEERYMALLDTEALVAPEEQQEFYGELEVALRTAVEKRDRVGQFLLLCDDRMSAIDAEIERLRKLKSQWERAQERMEQYVIRVIESQGSDDKGKYPKLKGNTCILGIQRNPSTVEITDEAAVPSAFKTLTITIPAEAWEEHISRFGSLKPDVLKDIKSTSVSINKRAIKKALDANEQVDGADLKFGTHRLKLD